MLLKSLRLCLVILLCWGGQAQAACPPVVDSSLPTPAARQLLVATQNAWLLHDESRDFQYDDAVPKARVDARLRALAAHIIGKLRSPHLLALQEVENRRLLERLVAAIKAQGGPDYQVNFLPAQDEAGNGVALLTRAPVVVGRVQSLFRGMKVADRKRAPLFSRLPLLVEVKQPLAMQVVVVHLRSAHGLDDPADRARVQAKRTGQASALIQWARQQNGDWLVLGDFNSAPGRGDFSLPWQLLANAGWQEAKVEHARDNYSYVFRCQRQQLDHVYLSPRLLARLEKTAAAHGNAGRGQALYASHGTQPVSDHDGMGVLLRFD